MFTSQKTEKLQGKKKVHEFGKGLGKNIWNGECGDVQVTVHMHTGS